MTSFVAKKVWQVIYTTYPDYREHIEQFDCFHKARDVARKMAEKHDIEASVIALDASGNAEPPEFCYGPANTRW